MAHVIQPAPTARAKCRGCGARIASGELRFGETVPNPFAEGDTTHWFHLDCAAFKRPDPFLEAVESTSELFDGRERLVSEAKRGLAHRRLPRINGAERSPTGRARCRSCREPIAKGAWRISLVYYENARFEPSGFLHVPCAPAYFETTDVLARLRHFSPRMSAEDVNEIEAELERGTAS